MTVEALRALNEEIEGLVQENQLLETALKEEWESLKAMIEKPVAPSNQVESLGEK